MTVELEGARLSSDDTSGPALTTQSDQPLLVVDDDPMARKMLARLLGSKGYVCETACDAEDALGKLSTASFALVLSDVDMPGRSGMSLLEEVAHTYAETATVMVTAMDDANLAERALAMGAYGYVIKPFEPNEILINVSNALRRRSLEIENRDHRARLEDKVKERTNSLWSAVQDLEKSQSELRSSQEETVSRLSMAAEFRDDETARHIERMSRYCGLLAKLTGEDDERARLIRLASEMHDIGKIGIPDVILLKPGPLTEEERVLMQQHAEFGGKILEDSTSPLLQLASIIAVTHHERMDGRGYPNGLLGDEIPREGRMAAIADVFDALTSNRVYRVAFPIGEAVDIMKAGRGTQFDAGLLDLFLDSLDSALLIAEELKD
jgi:putative two-component system response regulator